MTCWSCAAALLAMMGCGSSTSAPLCGASQVKAEAGSDPGMMLVSAGPFFQGCNATIDQQCASNEKPGRCVTLSAYEIDTTEVKQADYQACVKAGACTAPSNMQGCPDPPLANPDQPVVCIAWQQAADYCTWAGKRLPTEAEWEKAARGVDGRIYPWGNESPSCSFSNYSACGGVVKDVGTTVGDLSPYGVKDLGGNVAEWVNDWFADDYYASAPGQDPPGPSSGHVRGSRGSSYVDDASYLRTSARGDVTPDAQDANLGFRCAKSAG